MSYKVNCADPCSVSQKEGHTHSATRGQSWRLCQNEGERGDGQKIFKE